jgi:hypothetical protein
MPSSRPFSWLTNLLKCLLGAKLIYLPLYSPDFNPIEQAFSCIKAFLRRHESDALNDASRQWLIHQAAMAITPEDAEGWVDNCGYL